MFTVAERDRVRERVLEIAAADSRVVAGAVVGGLAHGGGDRWSDLDLTFGVADGIPPTEVLDDWTAQLAREFDAVHLFDVGDAVIYRVFVLPGCLQVDLSCGPASQFGGRGDSFSLLFGAAVELPEIPEPSAHELFGRAAHHALRARFSIERGRVWHAEYWISWTRDETLALACRQRGLETAYGRGFDDLPADVLDSFGDAFVRSLDRDELLRALARVIDGCCARPPGWRRSPRRSNRGCASFRVRRCGNRRERFGVREMPRVAVIHGARLRRAPP